MSFTSSGPCAPAVSGSSTAARSEERRLLLAAITPAPRLRFLTLRPLGAILSAAAVFAAAIFIVTGSGSGGDPAWAASAVKIA
ncbi:MAG: hypothetical protein H0X39_08160 [Actinobacteria bacterium]|nr:hypothetical protein [Actinomycetota bacterium]